MNIQQTRCAIGQGDGASSGRGFLDRLPGKRSFNLPAIRARAGLLNILLGVALASHLGFSTTIVPLILSLLILVDMLAALSLGLTPLSPTGMLGTLLASKHKRVPVPDLPKRFAWSMGATLALIIVLLLLNNASDAWVVSTLMIFFVLTWLDAVLGFCLGCWIYSRLFDCQSCSLL